MSIREANSIRVLSNGATYGEREKNSLTAQIFLQFNPTNPSYYEVLRNDEEIPIGAIVTDNTTSAKSEKLDDIKTIVLDPNEVLHIGDIFTLLSEKWICVKAEQLGDLYYKGYIQKMNNTFKFFSEKDSIVYEIPCVIGNKPMLGVSETTHIISADNSIIMTVQSNPITQQIKPNDVFKIGLYNHQVLTVPDDISAPYLLIFKIKFTETQQILPSPPEVIETQDFYLELEGNTKNDTEIKTGQTVIYTCVKKDSQGIDVDTQFNFMIDRGATPSSAYIFTILDDSSCSIKANNYMHYITLRVEDKIDSNLFMEKTIKLRSIM